MRIAIKPRAEQKLRKQFDYKAIQNKGCLERDSLCFYVLKSSGTTIMIRNLQFRSCRNVCICQLRSRTERQTAASANTDAALNYFVLKQFSSKAIFAVYLQTYGAYETSALS